MKEKMKDGSIDRPKHCVTRFYISPIPTSIFDQVRGAAEHDKSVHLPLRYYHLLPHILEKTGDLATGAIVTWVRP